MPNHSEKLASDIHMLCNSFLHEQTPSDGYVSSVNNPQLTGLSMENGKPVMLLTFSAVITLPASYAGELPVGVEETLAKTDTAQAEVVHHE